MQGQYKRSLVPWAAWRVVNPQFRYLHLRVLEACRHEQLRRRRLRKAGSQSRLRSSMRMDRTPPLAQVPSRYTQGLRLCSSSKT